MTDQLNEALELLAELRRDVATVVAERDALSVRLAQAEQNSTDLRAVWKATERELAEERARLREVEQERDEAIRLNEYEVLLRERDEAINDALNAEVRLREYEEALTRLDGAALLNQDAHDENVSVTIPIADWRAFHAVVKHRRRKRDPSAERLLSHAAHRPMES